MNLVFPHWHSFNTSLTSPQVYAHAGAVMDGKIYITCGRRGLAYLRETYCFDPAANQWTACAEGPVERAWHGMAAVSGRVYVIGGSNDERGYRRDVLKVQCHKSPVVFTLHNEGSVSFCKQSVLQFFFSVLQF